ncbi:MAG: HAMP domain-containing histidine kinase [Acidimicrobiia bacterium]|nr:HAMP domain-containing histidine kinase [Acidimicrobiia bacterium]
MTFRARLTLAAAAAVAVGILLASGAAFLALRHDLLHSVDETLQSRVNAVAGLARDGDMAEGAEGRDEMARVGGLAQIVSSDGTATALGGGKAAFPASAFARSVATTGRGSSFSTVRSADQHLRVLTVPLQQGTSLQVARSLEEVDRDLQRLALIFGVVAVAGVALAAGLGWLVARTALVPLDKLTETVEDVGETEDLTRRVEDGRRDELGRLTTSFNRLLAALEASRREQHQLVTDASHELRTPLTSLRTNVEVLHRVDELSPDERERLLADVVDQTDELTGLVASLVELARGEEPNSDVEELSLDELVADVVARSETHARTKDVRIDADLHPSHVRAGRARLERALANLVDNAVKWSPNHGEVEIVTRDGAVVVRDHGPGIAPEDLPHIFDRFYRSPAARGLPGSGLGLAIVRQVAEADGGSVRASNHPEGGAMLELRLPTHGDNGRRRPG